jgi:hypothetical protein
LYISIDDTVHLNLLQKTITINGERCNCQESYNQILEKTAYNLVTRFDNVFDADTLNLANIFKTEMNGLFNMPFVNKCSNEFNQIILRDFGWLILSEMITKYGKQENIDLFSKNTMINYKLDKNIENSVNVLGYHFIKHFKEYVEDLKCDTSYLQGIVNPCRKISNEELRNILIEYNFFFIAKVNLFNALQTDPCAYYNAIKTENKIDKFQFETRFKSIFDVTSCNK